MDIGDSYVRGFIEACEIVDGVLYMWAREAWGVTDFRRFLRSHYDDMQVYFVSEERGCNAYSTNDIDAKYFPYQIYVEYCIGNNEGVKDFRKMGGALKHFAEVLGVDRLTEEDVNQWNAEHENSDEYIYIYEYEIFD